MKKLLIATLALITALSISLAACDKNKDTDEPADNGDDDLIVRPSETTPVGGTTTPSNGDDSGNSGSSLVWTEKNDTVYVAANQVRYRSEANSNSTTNVKGMWNAGTQLSRTRATTAETGDKAWSEIKLSDGSLVYIRTEFLTDNALDLEFEACAEENITFDDNVYSVNLRVAPCFMVINDVKDGVAFPVKDVATVPVVTKIAVSKSGKWAKVKYNGKEYYVATTTFDGIINNDPSVGLG